MRNFFKIKYDADSRKFAYAASEVPSFDLLVCSTCGGRTLVTLDSFDIEVESGWEYPDNLMCGFAPWLFAVSERVVDAWNEAGVTGFTAHKIGIHKVLTRTLKKKIPKQYYHIVVNGRCENDLKKMKLKVKKLCPECGLRQFNKDTLKMDGLYIDENRWDGSDIFVSELFDWDIFVTKKILEITHKYNFTNFYYYPEEHASYNLYKKFRPKPVDLNKMFNDIL